MVFCHHEGEQQSQGFRLLSAPKKFPLKNPEISWEFNEIFCEDISKIEYQVKLTSKNIALYVFIESDKFDFIASDNFFSMAPSETKTIVIKDIELVNPSESDYLRVRKNDFTVKSLYDLLENS